MTAAVDPFVVHVARLRRSPGTTWHEIRRGPVEEAGPLDEEGVDHGRAVVPAGAEAECDVVLTPFSGGIDVSGTVSAPWVGECRRCCVPVTGELVVRVKERFGDEPVASDSEGEIYPIVDEAIDLGPMVRDVVVLELPMAPLCRVDCAGLCPQCGADHNDGPCGCLAPRDPRWANLDVLR